jgi:hypothetical protein
LRHPHCEEAAQTGGTVQSDVAALTRFSEFLTIARTAALGGVDRPLLERYLASLASQAIGHGARADAITSVSAFLQGRIQACGQAYLSGGSCRTVRGSG